MPSVTQAIGVVDKSGPLEHYASNKTFDGIASVLWDFNERRNSERQAVRAPYPGAFSPLAADEPKENRLALIAGLLKHSLHKRKLMFYHHTAEAALRGTDVHHIAEEWLERQVIPNLKDYPVNRHPYVQGFAKWLAVSKPSLKSSEMVVGSLEYGYAGRLDMTIVIRGHDGRTSLRDIKTSKGCYPRSHFPQLMAYEHARVEMGEEPTDDQGILLLTANGAYREVLARDVEFEDFRVLLEAHNSQSKIPECAECWRVHCNCKRPGALDKLRGLGYDVGWKR